MKIWYLDKLSYKFCSTITVILCYAFIECPKPAFLWNEAEELLRKIELRSTDIELGLAFDHLLILSFSIHSLHTTHS